MLKVIKERSGIMKNKIFEVGRNLLNEVEATQMENIEQAALLFADCLTGGGLIQAFGAGHSLAGALELTHRAGGFIPTKNIKEPAGGAYESIENVGLTFMKKVDVRPGDVVVVISNSGRNPLPIEVALKSKEKGAKIIAVTALTASKGLKSRHSGGENLYEIADVVLDNRIPEGDAMIEVEGVDGKMCGMSTFTTSLLLQACTLRAAEILVERGIKPQVYLSQNIDGARERNEAIEEKYVERLYRI